MIKQYLGRKWQLLTCIFLVSVLLSSLGVQVTDRASLGDRTGIGIGVGPEKVITLGHIAYAAGDVDYTYDGVDDHIQFQAALNALPATGGRLVDVSAVQKNFGAVVTRAIANVTIIGSGKGSYFVNDGITALFTAGGNGWKFQDLRTDAGGINMGATTGWQWLFVDNGSTVYDYRSSAGSIVNGAFTASSITDTGLTSGRVPLAGVGGLLGDSSNLTFDGTSLQVSSANVTRSATYVVAASDAPAHVKAQADYVATGANDNLVIQAAIDALPAGGGRVVLSAGTFSISSSINMASHVVLEGQGSSEYVFFAGQGYGVTHLVATNAIDGSSVIVIDGGAGTIIGAAVRRLSIYGSGNLPADDDNGIYVDSTDVFRIEDVQIENTRRGLFFDGLATAGQVYSSLFTNNETGAFIKGNNHSFSQVEFSHNSAYGVWVQSAGGVKFTASTAVSNSNGAGFYIKDSTVIQLVNTRAYNPGLAGGARGYDLDTTTYSIISGSIAEANDRDGFSLWNADNNVLVGNISVNNDDGNTGTYSGFVINNGSSNNVLVGNRATGNNLYQIQVVDGASANNTIVNNTLLTDEGLVLADAGTGTKIRSNLGYVTENSGTATMLISTGAIAVNHGLSANVTSALATMTSDPGLAVSTWVDTFTSTQFTIHTSANVTAATTFNWRAVVGAGN